MALNTFPNSTTIDTFIKKNGRPPELKNPEDVNEIEKLIRHNLTVELGLTTWHGGYTYHAAKAAIIDYWKAKRLASKA